MARAARSAGATAKSPAGSVEIPFRDKFFRPANLFRVALAAGVFALWPYAIQRLPSLEQRDEYRFKFSQIRVHPLPSGNVPADLVPQVERLAGLSADLSILDETLAADLAMAFSRHPWVSEVVSVRKSFPTNVDVELKYRVPVAFVETANGVLPIDRRGVVLPRGDFSEDEVGRFPLIKNIASRPAAQAGIVWSDPAVLAAARLAELLGEQWNALKLESIATSREVQSTTATDDVQLELAGAGGSRILWGRPPGTDFPGELEPTQKIRRLESYLTQFGDYGQPHGPYEIDIRHWRENTRRPLLSDAVQKKPGKAVRDDSKVKNSEGKRKTRS